MGLKLDFEKSVSF